MSDNGSAPEFRPHGLIVIQVGEAGHWSARLLDVDIHSALAALDGLRTALVADHERLHGDGGNVGVHKGDGDDTYVPTGLGCGRHSDKLSSGVVGNARATPAILTV